MQPNNLTKKKASELYSNLNDLLCLQQFHLAFTAFCLVCTHGTTPNSNTFQVILGSSCSLLTRGGLLYAHIKKKERKGGVGTMLCHLWRAGAFLPLHVAISAVTECPYNMAIEGQCEGGERHSMVPGARLWQAIVLGRGRTTNRKRSLQ